MQHKDGFHPDLGPASCPFGHFFEPGTFQVSWMPCSCGPALESRLGGHQVWRCNTCHDNHVSAVCYYPPHCPSRVPAS